MKHPATAAATVTSVTSSDHHSKMAPGLYFVVLLCLTSGLWAMPDGEGLSDDECCKRCPTGWTQFGDKCYIFYFNKKDWANAEVACIAVGGNLASVHTNEQYNFIKEMINRSTGTDLESWIGGHDAVKESVWMWSNGSKFDFKFWGKGEPNNAGGAENCLGINYNGFAIDISCENKISFVCAKNL